MKEIADMQPRLSENSLESYNLLNATRKKELNDKDDVDGDKLNGFDKDSSNFDEYSDEPMDESLDKDKSGSIDKKNRRSFDIFSSFMDSKDYCTNQIQSSKYNVISFLPLNLFT